MNARRRMKTKRTRISLRSITGWGVELKNMLAISVTKDIHTGMISTDILEQFIVVLSFLVISVTKDIHTGMISTDIFEQFIVVLSFLVITVINNLVRDGI